MFYIESLANVELNVLLESIKVSKIELLISNFFSRKSLSQYRVLRTQEISNKWRDRKDLVRRHLPFSKISVSSLKNGNIVFSDFLPLSLHPWEVKNSWKTTRTSTKKNELTGTCRVPENSMCLRKSHVESTAVVCSELGQHNHMVEPTERSKNRFQPQQIFN